MEDRFFSEEDRITEDRMDFRMIHTPTGSGGGSRPAAAASFPFK